MRKWERKGKWYYRCSPWTIGIFVLNGTETYVLSKDGSDKLAYFSENLKDVMNKAKELERGN